MSDNYVDFQYIYKFIKYRKFMPTEWLHPAIKHLTPEEIQNVRIRYVEGENVLGLLEEFAIKCSPTQLRRFLPRKVLDFDCDLCGAPMNEDLPMRNSRHMKTGKAFCSDCGYHNDSTCYCKYCQLALALAKHVKIEAARRQSKIFDALVAEQMSCGVVDYSLESLSLFQAVALVSFLQSSLIDAGGLCRELMSTSIPYAPTISLAAELLISLYGSRLILVSEYSEEGSVMKLNDKVRFIPTQVRWTGDTNALENLAYQIETTDYESWPKHWFKEIVPVWLGISLAECREYYNFCAGERGLEPKSDVAITKMLGNILRDRSTAECFNIIWHGAKNAANFLIKKKSTKEHATDYMVGACQRFADQARKAGSTLEPFKRVSSLPRSAVSYVFFDAFLKIGEYGFNASAILTAQLLKEDSELPISSV